MEKKNETNKAKKQAVENDNEKVLKEVAQFLRVNFRIVISIISDENYIKIFMTKDRMDQPRLTFCKILQELRKDYYLQVQEYRVINILFMANESHEKDQWWIELSNGQHYNISPDYRAIFLDNLNFMYKYRAIRLRNEEKCHKKKFISKYSY